MDTNDRVHEDFPFPLDGFLSAVAAMLSARGEPAALEMLTHGNVEVHLADYDNWNGGTYTWGITIRLPPKVYAALQEPAIKNAERAIGAAANEMFKDDENSGVGPVAVTASVEARPNWRDEALHFLSGSGVNNQGRVRSTNVAARTEDGLLFRSEPEVLLYRALKATGVTFAPLPVFLRGGETYRRVEPDFIIYKDRLLLVVELDGGTTHLEAPVDADRRLAMFKHEGAAVERVPTSECDTEQKARTCAQRLLGLLDKLARQR